ncbi:heterokaryon incompatibility protein-domain-containing protein [Xylariaceae sp. FL0255]|nr:heterokaryon incompatibility protein-domain-containing protein [Xylariaceae sp. FL0255]
MLPLRFLEDAAYHRGRPILRLYPGITDLPPITRANPYVSAFRNDSEVGRHDESQFDGMKPLRRWLTRCDLTHKCRNTKTTLPTRLLHVCPSDDPNDIRLDLPNYFEQRGMHLIAKKKQESSRYVALSHRWGEVDATEIPAHCTTVENIEKRKQGFKLNELPRTFQDAILVTHSISIVQDDGADWERESCRMQEVFSSAYCTLAATSAENCDSGLARQQRQHTFTYVRAPEGQWTCVSTNIADFDKDVNEADLNKRAWVLQERFLSPRILHFTTTQLYGECGEDIYAGENIFLESFHAYASKTYTKQHQKFQAAKTNLFEEYSGRDITKPTDRSIAISGLVDHIANALPCQIHFGITGWDLHRHLLWRRSSPGPRTGKILYKEPSVPSWSWLAYEGAIEFVHDSLSNLSSFRGLRINGRVLRAPVWVFAEGNMTVHSEGHILPYTLTNLHGSERGCVFLDVDSQVNALRLVVVVAKRQVLLSDNYRFFVLFVRPLQAKRGYQRLGMGMLTENCILRESEHDGHVL